LIFLNFFSIFSFLSPTQLNSSFHEKLVKSCHQINSTLSTECQKSFNKAFDNCLKNRDHRTCSNAFQSDRICGQKATNENLSCNPSSVIDTNFGDKFSTMIKLSRKFVVPRNNSQVSFSVKINQIIGEKDALLKVVQNTQLSTLSKLIQFLISIFMNFMFLKIIYGELF
jgi:hypothetical protein